MAQWRICGSDQFVIGKENNNGQNIYEQSINQNGKKIKKSFIDPEDVKKGGMLVLQMRERPKDDYSK